MASSLSNSSRSLSSTEVHLVGSAVADCEATKFPLHQKAWIIVFEGSNRPVSWLISAYCFTKSAHVLQSKIPLSHVVF